MKGIVLINGYFNQQFCKQLLKNFKPMKGIVLNQLLFFAVKQAQSQQWLEFKLFTTCTNITRAEGITELH